MEPMAIESAVASLWELDGFLAKTRHPVKIGRGYTDIDVVGTNSKREVRVAECKVPGPSQHIYVYNGACKFDDWLQEWGKLFGNIKLLWKDPPGWLPLPNEVGSFEVWFVANIWFENDDKNKAESEFTKKIKEECPHFLKGKASGKIFSTIDIAIEVINGVRKLSVEQGHGKRFGNQLLDIIREIIRYSNPKPTGGGRKGKRIAQETRERIIKSLGFK
jgi:hypothetical protein